MNTGKSSTAFRRLPRLSVLFCIAGIVMLLAACSPSSVQVPGTGSSAGNTNVPVATVVSAATATPTSAATGAATTATGSPTVGTPSTQPAINVITVLPATTGTPAVLDTLTPPVNGTTTPAATAGTPVATNEGTTVTLADDGKTVTLKVGQRFLLDLGSGMNWVPTVANQNIVSRVAGITVINGAQGVYQADAPGTTTLMANGEPTCLHAKPACAMPNRLFSVTIVVQ